MQLRAIKKSTLLLSIALIASLFVNYKFLEDSVLLGYCKKTVNMHIRFINLFESLIDYKSITKETLENIHSSNPQKISYELNPPNMMEEIIAKKYPYRTELNGVTFYFNSDNTLGYVTSFNLQHKEPLYEKDH